MKAKKNENPKGSNRTEARSTQSKTSTKEREKGKSIFKN